MLNSNLTKAKKAKNDEFYTLYEDIEEELQHYHDCFHGKIVYCNCDNPFESNFVRYFRDNFERLGLKELRATCWSGEPSRRVKSLLPEKSPKFQEPFYMRMTKAGTPLSMCMKYLDGNGDFRSTECLHILEDSDIVVTNPPFSLFRNFIGLMNEMHKEFLVVGSQNCLTSMEIYPLLKEGMLHLGYTFPKGFMDIHDNLVTFGNIGWFTSLPLVEGSKGIELTKSYEDGKYFIFENYEAINVDRLQDIPRDYDGVMGVPITLFRNYDSEQFEIVGFPVANDIPIGWKGMSASFVADYKEQGNEGHYNEGNRNPCYYDDKGKACVPFARVLIRNRNFIKRVSH